MRLCWYGHGFLYEPSTLQDEDCTGSGGAESAPTPEGWLASNPKMSAYQQCRQIDVHAHVELDDAWLLNEKYAGTYRPRSLQLRARSNSPPAPRRALPRSRSGHASPGSQRVR